MTFNDITKDATFYGVRQQMLSRWKPFKDLRQTFVVSLRAEQLRQRVHQRVVATVEDSALHTEMENLESEDHELTGSDQASSQR